MPKINFSLIGEMLMHPIQKDILRLAAESKTVSPLEIHKALGKPLGVVSYHVGVLAGNSKGKFAKQPLLALVKTEPRRGAVEHFYAATGAAFR